MSHRTVRPEKSGIVWRASQPARVHQVHSRVFGKTAGVFFSRNQSRAPLRHPCGSPGSRLSAALHLQTLVLPSEMLELKLGVGRDAAAPSRAAAAPQPSANDGKPVSKSSRGFERTRHHVRKQRVGGQRGSSAYIYLKTACALQLLTSRWDGRKTARQERTVG